MIITTRKNAPAALAVSPRTVARMTSVPAKHVYSEIASGSLPAYQRGTARRFYVIASDIEPWLRRFLHPVAAAPSPAQSTPSEETP